MEKRWDRNTGVWAVVKEEYFVCKGSGKKQVKECVVKVIYLSVCGE